MKLSLLSVTTLACTAFSAPTPQPIPEQLRRLELTLLDIVDDIHHGSTSLSRDYFTGMTQYTTLIEDLTGEQTCSPYTSSQAKWEDLTVATLQESRQQLLQFAAGWTTDDGQLLITTSALPSLCVAYSRYRSIRSYVESL